MIYEFIKRILKTCEYLSSYDIRCDVLTKREQSVSVVPTGEIKLIKEYRDGDRIIGTEFDLMIRLLMNDDNRENYTFLDKISAWINQLNLADYQEFINEYFKNCTPVRISVLSGPQLVKDDIRSGKYKIRLRIDCLYKM